MFTTDDFLSQYKKYSDEELMQINSNIDGYSAEAQEALKIAIREKGGLEALIKRLKEKQIIANEVSRIQKETAALGRNGVDASFIQNMTSSSLLSSEQVNEIISDKYAAVTMELEDEKIKPRTVFGSLIGGTIASVVGGVGWGLQMIFSGRIFYMLLIGLILLNYGIIKVSTKQSRKNSVVLITTIISVVLSLFLGTLLYEAVGYRG